jgi:hypothetical protein
MPRGELRAAFLRRCQQADINRERHDERGGYSHGSLQSKGLLSAVPFDEPIKFVYFDIWHDYGRTTKFGAWMQGADYSQWHGVYEILRNLAELKSMAADKLAASQ